MFARLALLYICAGILAANANWKLIQDSNPPDARYGGGGVYCEGRDSLLLFGGLRANAIQSGKSDYTNDLHEYSFRTGVWQSRPTPVSPSARIWFSFTALSSSNATCEAILYGGASRANNSSNEQRDSSETWLLSINDTVSWTKLDIPSGPGPRLMMQAVHRRGNVVLFGGSAFIAPRSTDAVDFNDLWTLQVGNMQENGTRLPSTWTETPRNPGSSVTSWPEPRFSHSMALSLGATPDEDQLVVFAGRAQETPSVWRMLSDLNIYTFGTNTWRAAVGMKLERTWHSSVVVNGRFFSFGGVTRIQTAPNVFGTFPFSKVVVTNLDASLDANVGSIGLDHPQCTASDGKYGLWCEIDISKEEDEPAIRFDAASILRRDELVIYGGRHTSMYGDFWRLNLTQAVDVLKIAEADGLGASDLASTMYFMIAILSMMVVCFMVFVISLRRQRNNNPMFQAMMVTRPRVQGARLSVIEALPLKTYKKKEADERRMSRRASRKDSQMSLKAAADGTSPATSSAAASAATASTGLVASTNPAEEGRIEQDDLHDLCAICLTDYEDGEHLRVLPCEHFFHPPCVDQWLRTHNACPMCKAAVDLDPERSEEPNPSQQVVAAAESAENPNFRDGESAMPNNADDESATSRDTESRVATSNVSGAPPAQRDGSTMVRSGSSVTGVVFHVAEARRPSAVTFQDQARRQSSAAVTASAADEQVQRRQSSTAPAAANNNDDHMVTIDLSNDNANGVPVNTANV